MINGILSTINIRYDKVNKRIYICIIVFFLNFTTISTLVSQEQTFREDLEKNQSEIELSYEQYQKELAKLLEPKEVWDFNLNFIIFPLGVIAFGIVIIFFVKQIRINLISEANNEESEMEVDQVKTERAALAHADTAEASNDFRGALRYLYLSAILHLQERGILPYDKSLTNREYLHQAQVDTDIQKTLGPAINVFDEVWYGYKPCNAETVANYRDLLQKIYVRN